MLLPDEKLDLCFDSVRVEFIGGFFLVALSLIVFVLSLRTKAKSFQISSILALATVISAAVGGVLFVFSGFQDNGNSAQMSGSFIAAYALYFIELYFTK